MNLSPAIAGTGLYTHIRRILWTTVPSLVITLTLSALIGLRSEHIPGWAIVIDAMGLGMFATLGTGLALEAGASPPRI